MGTVWAVVVAAGQARRYGSAKQYERIGGRSVLEWSLCAARNACDGVIAVVRAVDVGRRPFSGDDHPDLVVAGGETRSASVRAGLAVVPEGAEVIVVHDAARPLAGPELWRACIQAVRDGADAALCAVPMSDTIKRVDGNRVVATLDRTGLVAVQTPQAFSPAALRAAHASGGEATDDGALVEAIGGTVVVVAGSPANLKITHPADLVVAAALADRRPWPRGSA